MIFSRLRNMIDQIGSQSRSAVFSPFEQAKRFNISLLFLELLQIARRWRPGVAQEVRHIKGTAGNDEWRSRPPFNGRFGFKSTHGWFLQLV